MSVLAISKKYYQAPKKKYWLGRKTKPELGNQYWYQEIELIDATAFQYHMESCQKPHVGLLGYVCDEGVRRNLGRVGAKNGAKALKQRLAKLPFHHKTKKVADFGDVGHETTLETCHAMLSAIIAQMISNSIFPMLIGGGHDIAYGHFNGIRLALKNAPKSKIGIINLDAHFDLRPLDKKANSGTPFYQILNENNNVEYCVLGIQEQSNTKELFDIAKKHRVTCFLNYECVPANLAAIEKGLSHFAERNDWLYITIDMDGFSSAYAPGVSAPSPMGFTPYFVLRILKYLLNTKKVISCDIAELNPKFDRDNTTTDLAARIVDFIVSNL